MTAVGAGQGDFVAAFHDHGVVAVTVGTQLPDPVQVDDVGTVDSGETAGIERIEQLLEEKRLRARIEDIFELE